MYSIPISSMSLKYSILWLHAVEGNNHNLNFLCEINKRSQNYVEKSGPAILHFPGKYELK